MIQIGNGKSKPRDGGSLNRNETALPPVQRDHFLSRLTNHIPPGQFFRYLLVGGWNTIFGYSTFAGIYYCLHRFTIPTTNVYWQVTSAQIVSVPINFTASYLSYKFLVFKTRGNYLREWLKSIAVYGTGFLPGLVLLPLLVKALLYLPYIHGSAPYIANALLTAVVVVYSFLGHKHVTFKVAPGADSGAEQ
jgi:putative flippase GtrA